MGSWAADQKDIQRIREQVFIHEQGVRPEEEWDGLDSDCQQVLAFDHDGQAVGTARITATGKIGRLAVLPASRGQKVASAMMAKLLAWAADQGLAQVCLDAQTGALGFYQRLGFVAQGPVFLDARMPHRHMVLARSPDNP